MTLTQLFTQISGAYRGTDDDSPVEGSVDYIYWLAVANRKISEWFQGENWVSLFSIESLGTVTAGTQTYDLEDTIILPADRVTVTTTTGHDIDYRLVKPQERGRYPHSVYISGRDPQTLTFSDTIESTDQIVGGTIYVAGYYMPDDLVNASDTVPCDDPYWLVYAVASELAFNDLTYAAKAPDLVAKANNLWSGMVLSNRRGSGNNPRVARTNVTAIGSTEGRL